MPAMTLDSRLAERTLQLVDVASESRHESALMELVRMLVPGPSLYDDGECLLAGEPGAPVLLAGHLDTVPAQGNVPGRIEDGAVHGLGASDMKSGVALMVELARQRLPARYLFFTREEVPVAESPLPALFASGLIADARLAVVLEPTDCILRARPLARRRRAEAALARGARRRGDPEQLPVGAARPDESARSTPARARAGRRSEAGVDA